MLLYENEGNTDLRVPDHSTLSRRGRTFARRQPRVRVNDGPVHLVLDSTGLELFGLGEWCAAKHGRARRRWLKLHLGVKAATGEIAAHVLTDGHADDAAQVPDLLRQPEGDIASLTADGAYDGDPVYQAAAARQSGRPPDVIIPPRSSAVLSGRSGQAVNRSGFPGGCLDWVRQPGLVPRPGHSSALLPRRVACSRSARAGVGC